jgi:hypothetical protein
MKKIMIIAAILTIVLLSFPSCRYSPAEPADPTPTCAATVTSDNENDAYEPDNNSGSATSISASGISQHHNMFDGTDDYFQFCVTAGAVYRIRAVATTAGASFNDFFLWDGVSSYELYSQSQDNATCVMTIYPDTSGVFHFFASRNNNNGPDKGYDITVTRLLDVIPVNFNTAVDNQALTFSFSGDAVWYGQGNIYSVAGGAAQSPHLTITQSAAFETQVTGPCTVSFRWKVSSETDKGFSAVDALSFKVDGSYIASIYGEADWAGYSLNITGSGVHTLSWDYSKDGTQTAGYDAAWVDDIQVTY